MNSTQKKLLAGGAILVVTGLTVGLVVKAVSGSSSDPANIIDKLISEGRISSDFTATENELDVLINLGYAEGSPVYQELLDQAYARALEEAERIDGSVSWSPSLGYYATTQIY